MNGDEKRSDEWWWKEVMKIWWWNRWWMVMKIWQTKTTLQNQNFSEILEASLTSQMNCWAVITYCSKPLSMFCLLLNFNTDRFSRTMSTSRIGDATLTKEFVVIFVFRNRSTKPCFSNFLVLSRIEHWTMKWWRMLCLEVTRTLSSLAMRTAQSTGSPVFGPRTTNFHA